MTAALAFQLPNIKITCRKILQQQEMFHVKHALQKNNLLLAGGRAPKKAWLKKLTASENYKIFCADKGVIYALAAGLSPALVVGDCDSTDMQAYKAAQESGARIDLHSPAKDDTDLQLLLQQLPEGNLVVTGIWGGRFDHLFSNVYSLLAFKQQRDCQVIMADDNELMVLLNSDEAVVLFIDEPETVQAVSWLTLSAAACVSIDGVRWPLHNAELTQQRPYAISNLPTQNNVTCQCLSGNAGIYIRWRDDRL